MLAVLCIAVPVMQFSYRMRGRDIDLWYSLPVTREKLTLARTLGGLMLIFVPYTLSYWFGFVIVLLRENYFVLYGYPLYYLVSLPLGALLFGVYSFLYTRANSVGDGLVCMAGWTFALMLPFAFLSVQFPRLDLPRSFSVWQLTPFGLLSLSADYFNELICADALPTLLPLAWTIPLTVSEGAGAYAGLFLTARRHKAENGGQLSLPSGVTGCSCRCMFSSSHLLCPPTPSARSSPLSRARSCSSAGSSASSCTAALSG